MGSLEEVHMPQNGINYAGVMALASAMRHNPELRVLNFNDNTFTKRGTLAMAQVRPVHSQTIPTNKVDIASVFEANCFSTPVLVIQALRHLRNVQVINFGDCLVRCEGAIALAAVLREGLPILKVSHQKSPQFRRLCQYVSALSTHVMYFVFRNSICHSGRSLRQRR